MVSIECKLCSFFQETRGVLRLVWPSILLQCACGRLATAAETDRVTAMERYVRKTA